jgi:radical SAM superfamily enzyme YgiQ (UPF0313 family)
MLAQESLMDKTAKNPEQIITEVLLAGIRIHFSGVPYTSAKRLEWANKYDALEHSGWKIFLLLAIPAIIFIIGTPGDKVGRLDLLFPVLPAFGYMGYYFFVQVPKWKKEQQQQKAEWKLKAEDYVFGQVQELKIPSLFSKFSEIAQELEKDMYQWIPIVYDEQSYRLWAEAQARRDEILQEMNNSRAEILPNLVGNLYRESSSALKKEMNDLINPKR